MDAPRRAGRTTKAKGRIERFHQLEDSKLVVNNTSLEMKSVSSRLGKKIIELAHVSKSFDGVPVIADFTYTVLRSDRIGIIGENGSGEVYASQASDRGTDAGQRQRGNRRNR